MIEIKRLARSTTAIADGAYTMMRTGLGLPYSVETQTCMVIVDWS